MGCIGKRKRTSLAPESTDAPAEYVSTVPQHVSQHPAVLNEPTVPDVPVGGRRMRDNATTMLLAHAVLSYLVLRTLPVVWRPPGLSSTAWRQSLGIFLIFVLAIHTIEWMLSCYVTMERPQGMSVMSVSPAATYATEELIPVEELTGRWMKDKEASDSMDPVCNLMQLNSLLRAAINLIKGIDIQATSGSEFKFAVLSGVLWFKIRESYPLDGTEVRHRRRDFRGGGSLGKALPCPGGGVTVHHRFGPVMAGTMEERFYCPDPTTLNVVTTLDVPSRGPPITYTQIYRKKL